MQTVCLEIKQMCLKASYAVIKAEEELLETMRDVYSENLCPRQDLMDLAELINKRIADEKEYIKKLRNDI